MKQVGRNGKPSKETGARRLPPFFLAGFTQSAVGSAILSGRILSLLSR
jgi:hypothetical protein